MMDMIINKIGMNRIINIIGVVLIPIGICLIINRVKVGTFLYKFYILIFPQPEWYKTWCVIATVIFGLGFIAAGLIFMYDF